MVAPAIATAAGKAAPGGSLPPDSTLPEPLRNPSGVTWKPLHCGCQLRRAGAESDPEAFCFTALLD